MLDCDERLRTAYNLEQELYEINSETDYNVAKKRLREWIFKCEDLNIAELNEVARTYKHYFEYIANSFLTKYTNSWAEGKNTAVKTYKRICFGCKDLNLFLKRVMHIEANR